MKTISFLLASLSLSTLAAAGAGVGQPAPAFTLQDVDGKAVNLADYRGKTVVLEWHNFGCPFVKKHSTSSHSRAGGSPIGFPPTRE